MSSRVTCPVCGSSLKRMTKSHINTKKHQSALKEKGISPSEDPAKDLMKKKKTKSRTRASASTVQLQERLDRIEQAIQQLKSNQQLILEAISSSGISIKPKLSTSKPEPKFVISEKNIKSAIMKCVQNNRNQSLWVKLDDVISILKLNQEEERYKFYKLLVKMFNKNMIDLAEGGDPKYPLKFQNRIYGMVALQ